MDNLERIEPPSQLIAGLGDPLVQRYLLLNKSADSVRRLEFWLEANFEMEIEVLEEGFGLSPTLTEILSALRSYTEFTKVRIISNNRLKSKTDSLNPGTTSNCRKILHDLSANVGWVIESWYYS